MCQSPRRQRFGAFWGLFRREPRAIVVPATDGLFQAGRERYLARGDKEWSLTDCTSFVRMEREGLAEALPADHHFEQAGFVTLLA